MLVTVLAFGLDPKRGKWLKLLKLGNGLMLGLDPNLFLILDLDCGLKLGLDAELIPDLDKGPWLGLCTIVDLACPILFCIVRLGADFHCF